MRHLLSLGTKLAAFGGPGLFAIAFLDSSFLSLPEINDLLIITFVMQHKERLVYYALMSTLGSIAGCFVVYVIGWKGGEAVLRKWFSEGRVEQSMASFRRYGWLAILVPSILPPPAPFKIFVLLAGVARVPLRKFVGAIVLGRGVRYLGEGLLAVWYGEAALGSVREHGKEVALVAGVAVLVGGIAYFWWQGRRGRPRGEV